MSRSKNWCLTLNNYNDHELIFDPVTMVYLVYGREVSGTGTPHLQGYVVLHERTRIGTVKRMFNEPRIHLQTRLGTQEQAINYCKKGEQSKEEWNELNTVGPNYGLNASVEEYGIPPVLQQGKRNDIYDAQRLLLEGKTYAEITEEIGPGWIRSINSITKYVTGVKNDKARSAAATAFNPINTILLPWQQALSNELLLPVDDRKVIWYHDSTGNCGKTWFSKYVMINSDAIRFENGKSADIKYAYSNQNIVMFDYTRSVEDHINYEVIEAIKNGTFLNTKYDSRVAVFKIPHVIIFSNSPPDLTKLSMDRWDIRTLTATDAYTPPLPPVNCMLCNQAHSIDLLCELPLFN